MSDALPDSAFVRGAEVMQSRTISSSAFLGLWTANEVAAGMADDDLQFAALQAIAEGSVNLDSPRLKGLLALAVSKGALTEARAAQIMSGLPSAT